ncbi:unnamed protein product [Ceratitis capitata]|uniref:(Mediterranean fruit fly) hypothetical protein n=1 Tax=Ceratitis capitata TaxID=7213 RepID=A0A811U454_CERCA|nr:unnamed protein product [Ceratitis capitata]
MFEFSKMILLLLICVSGLIGGSEQHVVVKPNKEHEKGIVPFATRAANGDVNTQRMQRSLLDQILFGLFDYLDYSDEDESEEDEKYLICRNCTILISHDRPPIQTTVAPTYLPTMRNEEVTAASSTTKAPATPIVQPNGAPAPMQEP